MAQASDGSEQIGERQGQNIITTAHPHRSHRSAFDTSVELIATEGTALVPLPDPIGRQRGIGLERFVAVVLGAERKACALSQKPRALSDEP
jgi:hypothetical protein